MISTIPKVGQLRAIKNDAPGQYGPIVYTLLERICYPHNSGISWAIWRVLYADGITGLEPEFKVKNDQVINDE